MYVAPLRQKFLDEHSNLCRMIDVIVALVLYADDAAIPADSISDLQLSLDIFERFCNANRLYIAVSKTFLTVFHNENDKGVVHGNGGVWVDGEQVLVYIYGMVVAATPNFKYLGVTLNSTGTNTEHLASTCKRF